MRASGILMPVFSLPSKYGIGDLGCSAYKFVDFLKAAGQKYWQILPLGITGYGDSPYQSFSAFAQNPYFISPDILKEEGLIFENETGAEEFKDQNPESIDYGCLCAVREKMLRLAVSRLNTDTEEYRAFYRENSFWLDDYAAFMALKNKNGMQAFSLWNDSERIYTKQLIEQVSRLYGADIRYYSAVQFLFYRQWKSLKEYANKNGVKILGDMPIYVSSDSADLWARPELFKLDENRRMTEVAGCPPDSFAPLGQLWGNPLYNWRYHHETGYDWWIKRLEYAVKTYDAVRIDHFRGFESYYAIPSGDKTAVNGCWYKGPDIDFINAIKAALPKAEIIAEDLGFLTPAVYKMLAESGFPGMKVLQFAFSGDSQNEYLPHNYTQNCVVYTGTHDNTTARGWLESAAAEEKSFVKDYLAVKDDCDFVPAFIRTALSSVAKLAIIPMPDWLGLGDEARINKPSTIGGNWLWRMRENAADSTLCAEILRLAKLYGR